jgi:nitrogen regulation protein NR(I)
MKPRILIIEDDQEVAVSLQRALQLEGYEVHTAADVASGLEKVARTPPDVVVTDLNLSGSHDLESKEGFQLIREVRAVDPHVPVILMTAHHTTDIAIETTKLGAYEYIVKPFHTQELIDVVARAFEGKRLMSDPVELGTAAPEGDAIIGNSRAMQTVYKEIGRVATTPVTVLIRGETGTGKELIARAVYQHSNRADKPFIVVNCVAIPETLLESELFGHEQGAFTGANVRRIGRFEQADGGTIFLDEVGDMSMSTQAKLLRVLQEKTIQRLGGKEPISIDVRVIAATHRDLESAMRESRFREDLYYRLNVAVIQLPSLRARREDIPALVKYFLHRHGPELGSPKPSITPEAIEYLQQHDWPGNVRELENGVRKALLLAHGHPINLHRVRESLVKPDAASLPSNQTIAAYVSNLLARAVCAELENVHAALTWDIERELYSQAIELARGNQAKAAKWLGVSRPTMREKLRLYGLRALPESGGS